jgi:RNA polymerase sigma factor (sigma-70 family)
VNLMNDEATLLRRYAEEGSEAAFTELVRRHIDLVYSAALRRTGGDTHLATDVAQQVFIALARNARKLSDHTVLSAWLHTATRNAALNLMMSEQRRKAREQAAFALEPAGAIANEPNWDRMRPVLDAAIDELPESDRAVVVLRFLERRPFATIGAALHVSEDAARMRTERALEKLRAALSRRGITSTAAALGAIVAAQPLMSAPAGLAATFASTALAATGTTGVIATLTLLMNTKLVTAGVSALVAFGLGMYFSPERSVAPPPPSAPEISQHAQTIASLRHENDRLKADVARLNSNVGQLNATLAAVPVVPPPEPAPAPVVNPRALVDPQLLAYQQQRAMIAMLRQFGGAAHQFRKEHGRWPTTIDELVGERKYIRRILTVDGEDYSGLQFRDGEKLTVKSVDGVTATLDLDTGQPDEVLPSPAADLAKELGQKVEPAAKKALEAYRAANGGAEPRNPQALLPYFTSPQEGADFFEYLEAAKVARVN